MSSKFSLKWNDFENNLSKAFGEFKDDVDLTDVTLVCEDNIQIESHKIVLSASSSFFQNILKRNKHSHPLLYLKGVSNKSLVSILDFIYHGEVNINTEDLEHFITLGKDLQIKGLQDEFENSVETNKPPILRSEYKIKTESKIETVAHEIEYHTDIDKPKEDIKSAPVKDKKVFTVSGEFEDLHETINSMLERRDGVWTCKICGKQGTKSTSVKNDIKKHIAANHIDGMSYMCHNCNKTFKTDRNLSRHVCKQMYQAIIEQSII